MQPFRHANLTLRLLENRIQHMSSKWKLYYSEGYLPKTRVFDDLIEEIESTMQTTEILERLIQKSVVILDKASTIENNKFKEYLDKNYNLRWAINAKIEKIENDKGIQLSTEKDTLFLVLDDNKTEATLIIDDGRIDTFKVANGNGKLIIYRDFDNHGAISGLSSLRNALFYDIEGISDIINALNYGFLNRLTGIVASDPLLGMEVVSRQYGGLQLIHNAAESLMTDYMGSLENNSYDGIVVFGFKNRASTLVPFVVQLPSFAEHDIEYMVILAHEAYHLTTCNPQEKLFEKKLNLIRTDLQKSLSTKSNNYLASLYLPETLRDKNTPDALITKVVADDIMADIFATIVAGEAYPRILGRYYLPIILDVNPFYEDVVDEDTLDLRKQSKYCSFAIGSLKLRAAAITLDMMGWNDEMMPGIKEELTDQINYWEGFSKKLALASDESITRLQDDMFYKIDKIIESVCNAIKDENVPRRMHELIRLPYYPKEENERMQLKKELETIKGIFKGEPDLKYIDEIRRRNVLKPRHLISLLALDGGEINRNALLMTIGYHEYILKRFIKKRVK